MSIDLLQKLDFKCNFIGLYKNCNCRYCENSYHQAQCFSLIGTLYATDNKVNLGSSQLQGCWHYWKISKLYGKLKVTFKARFLEILEKATIKPEEVSDLHYSQY